MNNDQIIRLAQEAGLPTTIGWLDSIMRFAAAVAAVERDRLEIRFKKLEALMQIREQQPNKPCCLEEREACAKLAEAYEPRCDTCPSGVANAIRGQA